MLLPTSDEFASFCKGLHQDFMLYGPEFRDWISGAIGFVRRDRLNELRAFVDDLLTKGYSDKELQAIYRSTASELVIWEDRGVRKFLALLRDILDERLSN